MSPTQIASHALASLTFVVSTAGCVVSNQGAPGTPPEIPLDPEIATIRPATQTVGPSVVSARHILISYKGAMRAAPYIERTKTEARDFAESLQRKAKAGADFAKLAEDNSDDPGSAAKGGSLGSFKREQMVREFSDTAFALEIGELSDVVESPFGFHVILRDD